ncbi:MAG: hypothetical protein CL676_01310 [Bdellovibrionaceae bacterium]|nr:hypothetical protein [Pseudobdellovibrionaceae bacterium]
MNQNDSKLKPLLHKIQSESSAGIACIFDIDSTLYCVSSRTQAILRTLGKEQNFKTSHPELSEALQTIQVESFDWGFRAPLERLNMAVPPEAIQSIRGFWKKNFFSNSFLVHDLLYPNANEFVQMCMRHGAEIFYLTGRSDSLMREGTLEQLERDGFPLASEDHLIMKTNEDLQDEDFKSSRLKDFGSQFSKIYFFENEPVIVESVMKDLPHIELVFMDSTHSQRRPRPEGLPTITPDSFAEAVKK